MRPGGKDGHRLVVTPPSTKRVWPFTKEEAAPARKTAATISSCTLLQRRAGVRLASQAERQRSAGEGARCWMPALLTRMSMGPLRRI